MITPGADEATVEWSFPGDISDLSHYMVKAEADGEEKPIELTIHDVQKKEAILRPLPLSSKYTVAVTAVYRDGFETKGIREFFNKCGGYIHVYNWSYIEIFLSTTSINQLIREHFLRTLWSFCCCVLLFGPY